MADAQTKLVADLSLPFDDPGRERVVELTPEELAQRDADTAEALEARKADRKRALLELRAKRDRLLAQTDVLALPASAWPVDMPQSLKDAIAANLDAWLAWRQALRDLPSTITASTDPRTVEFPAPPAAPSLILT
jgi:hypothetical protein